MPGTSIWPTFKSTVHLVMRHSRDVVATRCGGGVTLTALNCPMWIPNLNYDLYSRCCPLLYPSQPADSISSCLQPTLTEVTRFVDPQSGSLVTLGHATSNNNTRDVISNGVSDSRTQSTDQINFHVFSQLIFVQFFYVIISKCKNSPISG